MPHGAGGRARQGEAAARMSRPRLIRQPPRLPHTERVSFVPLRWLDPPAGPAIELLDQTRLPATEAYVTCADVPSLIDAITRLVVRGAPLLGIAGAFGVALAAARGDDGAGQAHRGEPRLGRPASARRVPARPGRRRR